MDLEEMTAEYEGISKVRCRIGLKYRLELKTLRTNWNKKQRTSDV